MPCTPQSPDDLTGAKGMHNLLAVRLAMVCNILLSKAHEDDIQVQSFWTIALISWPGFFALMMTLMLFLLLTPFCRLLM